MRDRFGYTRHALHQIRKYEVKIRINEPNTQKVPVFLECLSPLCIDLFEQATNSTETHVTFRRFENELK